MNISDISYLTKLINLSKSLTKCQKTIWHKPVISVEEVTVISALLTLCTSTFPRIEALCLTIPLTQNSSTQNT